MGEARDLEGEEPMGTFVSNDDESPALQAWKADMRRRWPEPVPVPHPISPYDRIVAACDPDHDGRVVGPDEIRSRSERAAHRLGLTIPGLIVRHRGWLDQGRGPIPVATIGWTDQPQPNVDHVRARASFTAYFSNNQFAPVWVVGKPDLCPFVVGPIEALFWVSLTKG